MQGTIADDIGLACRMAQMFKPKAMDYIHRAIVQAIADAKAEAAPCKQPPREELPQDLIEMLTGYKQVRIATCYTAVWCPCGWKPEVQGCNLSLTRPDTAQRSRKPQAELCKLMKQKASTSACQPTAKPCLAAQELSTFSFKQTEMLQPEALEVLSHPCMGISASPSGLQ